MKTMWDELTKTPWFDNTKDHTLQHILVVVEFQRDKI